MYDGGVANLFFHSPKVNIGFEPPLYVSHNPVAILVTPVAILEHSCSGIVLFISLK